MITAIALTTLTSHTVCREFQKGGLMLSTNQLSKVMKELILELPPSLTTDEANNARIEIAKDLARMKEQGITPELPYSLLNDD